MGRKLYVGNLPWSIRTEDLRSIFEAHGEITDVIVLTDRETGRSRGFGFVEFASEDQAQAAIEANDGREVEGRNLKVNVARERPPRGGGGGGGGRGPRW